eukprot:TRINITY_DN13939_c0_g1_i15.p2 TRINITY_DN13939_c0_g1~~TRINITY_DN13939_c0_g1_i15.p2  ORF type:complete len:380 (-),score=18.38 TRINITY_DN13939_c0_g1_i15:349-1488(-)
MEVFRVAADPAAIPAAAVTAAEASSICLRVTIPSAGDGWEMDITPYPRQREPKIRSATATTTRVSRRQQQYHQRRQKQQQQQPVGSLTWTPNAMSILTVKLLPVLQPAVLPGLPPMFGCLKLGLEEEQRGGCRLREGWFLPVRSSTSRATRIHPQAGNCMGAGPTTTIPSTDVTTSSSAEGLTRKTDTVLEVPGKLAWFEVASDRTSLAVVVAFAPAAVAVVRGHISWPRVNLTPARISEPEPEPEPPAAPESQVEVGPFILSLAARHQPLRRMEARNLKLWEDLQARRRASRTVDSNEPGKACVAMCPTHKRLAFAGDKPTTWGWATRFSSGRPGARRSHSKLSKFSWRSSVGCVTVVSVSRRVQCHESMTLFIMGMR